MPEPVLTPDASRPLLLLMLLALLMSGCLGARSGTGPPEPTPTAAPPPIVATATPRPPDPTPTRIPPQPTRSASSRGPINPERLSLALDGASWAGQAGLFVALERGYLQETGLDVYVHVAQSPGAALVGLMSGEDDLAIVGGAEVLRARDGGAPIVALQALVDRALVELVLATDEETLVRRDAQLRRVVAALERGYADAGRDPAAAAATLARARPGIERAALEREMAELAPLWRSSPVGRHDEARWRQSHAWLVESGLAGAGLDVRRAFTNVYLPLPTPTPSPTATPRPPTATPLPTAPPSATPTPAPPTTRPADTPTGAADGAEAREAATPTPGTIAPIATPTPIVTSP